MKVPVLDSQRVAVRPVATPYSNLDARSGMGEVGRGLGDLRGGILEAQKNITAEADKAKKAAEDFRFDRAKLEFGHENNHYLHEKDHGFLNKLGEEAIDETPTLEALGKAKERISKGLPTDELRQRFDLEAQRQMQQSWARMENHVAEQRMRVYENVSNGTVKLALDNAALNYHDPKAVEDSVNEALVTTDPRTGKTEPGPLRRFLLKKGLPKEAVEAAENDFQEKAYGAALQGYLDNGDVEGADAYYARIGKKLGTTAPAFEKKIGAVRFDLRARVDAEKLVDGARYENGRVDQTKVDAAIDAISDPRLRLAVEQKATQRVAQEEKKWNKVVDGHYNNAFTSFLEAGRSLARVDPQDKLWLIDNAPEEWNKLEALERKESEYDRKVARRSASGHKESADQADALIAVKADINAHPEKYHGMSIEAFRREWGHRLSGSGYKQAGDRFAVVQKDDPVKASEFASFVKNDVKSSPALANKKDAAQYEALMGDQRRLWKETHKGEPGPEDLAKMRERVWIDKATWFGFGPTKKVLRPRDITIGASAPAPAPAPAAKATGGTKSTLKPGLYKDKSGKTVIVDEQGNKRFE